MRRHEHNPILTPGDVSPTARNLTVAGVHNAAPFRLGGRICLLLRVTQRVADRREGKGPVLVSETVEGRLRVRTRWIRLDHPHWRGLGGDMPMHKDEFHLAAQSHLRIARSDDGVRFTVDDEPVLTPQGPLETHGVEDPRVVKIGRTWWINYSSVSTHGVCTSLASTKDWETFERHGVIMPSENRNIAIFPEKSDKSYWALQRPARWTGGGEMWIMRSPDLKHWGDHRLLMSPRPGKWDGARIGATGAPIRTDRGWLVIYHGKRDPKAAGTYSLGAALLDGENPARLIGRSAKPILRPRTRYERNPGGLVPDVIFSNGQLVDDDGAIHLYYGAADSVMCLARTHVEEVLSAIKPI